jgi:DNA-binding response OmpR family regulator
VERVRTGRVLLIEDDPAFLGMMSAAFEVAGYTVLAAADGDEGLALFNQSPADLVVIDMITPVRDGVEAIVALRRTASPVSIVAISGGFCAGPEYYLDLANHLGADMVMAKPFPVTALLSAAERLLAAPDGAPRRDYSEKSLEATYDLADRLDDAVILARLLLADRAREPADQIG